MPHLRSERHSSAGIDTRHELDALAGLGHVKCVSAKAKRPDPGSESLAGSRSDQVGQHEYAQMIVSLWDAFDLHVTVASSRAAAGLLLPERGERGAGTDVVGWLDAFLDVARRELS